MGCRNASVEEGHKGGLSRADVERLMRKVNRVFVVQVRRFFIVFYGVIYETLRGMMMTLVFAILLYSLCCAAKNVPTLA